MADDRLTILEQKVEDLTHLVHSLAGYTKPARVVPASSEPAEYPKALKLKDAEGRVYDHVVFSAEEEAEHAGKGKPAETESAAA
jgi:hypothetical protein